MGRFVVEGSLPPPWDAGFRRRLALAGYYLAIIVGLALVHLGTGEQTTRFIYQAF